jgi:hypothetical protein
MRYHGDLQMRSSQACSSCCTADPHHPSNWNWLVQMTDQALQMQNALYISINLQQIRAITIYLIWDNFPQIINHFVLGVYLI